MIMAHLLHHFEARFAKLRKATIDLAMSVRLFAWKKIGHKWADFHEILYVNIV